MTIVESEQTQPSEDLRYGRFPRRFQAVLIDGMVISLAMAAGISAVIALNSDDLRRVIGFLVAAGWLLYEPVLVAFFGSTIGHYYCNLRVVDDRGGNVGFIKAVVRSALKASLGILSFVSMATTRRHQAIHDVLTRSTVQIRDAAKASPETYRSERMDLSSVDMPSRDQLPLNQLGNTRLPMSVSFRESMGFPKGTIVYRTPRRLVAILPNWALIADDGTGGVAFDNARDYRDKTGDDGEWTWIKEF